MILPDYLIYYWAVKDEGVIPYQSDHVNPASIDLTLGNSYTDLLTGITHKLDEPLTLIPGDAILATTAEYIKLPPHLAACVYLKSTLARQGLDHALAGWVDPGFMGQLTLELHSHRPVELKRGQRLVQLVLMQMQGTPVNPYQGRYQGQTGPTMARVETDYAPGGKVGLK